MSKLRAAGTRRWSSVIRNVLKSSELKPLVNVTTAEWGNGIHASVATPCESPAKAVWAAEKRERLTRSERRQGPSSTLLCKHLSSHAQRARERLPKRFARTWRHFRVFDLRHVCFLLLRFLAQRQLNPLPPISQGLLLENPALQERCPSRPPAPQDCRRVSPQGGQSTSQWQSIEHTLTSVGCPCGGLVPAPGFDRMLVRCLNIMYVIQMFDNETL